MMELKLASAGNDIKIWDCGGYTCLKQFNPHSGSISSLDWSCDNTFLATASTTGDKVVLTYTKSAAYNTSEVAVNEGRTCASLNSNSRYLLTGGPDTTISVFDLKRQKLMKTYKDHKSGITSVQFNWNDAYIASSSESGQIIVHNVVTAQGSSPLTAPKAQAIRQLQYSYFKKSLLGSASDDGAINLWDANTRRIVHSFNDGHRAPCTGLAFSPINEMLLTSVGLDKRIVYYDVQGKSPVKTMTADQPLVSIDIMHDGCTLAVGSTRGNIYIYDLRHGGTPVRTINAHNSSVQCLKFQKPVKPAKLDSAVKSQKSSSSSIRPNSHRSDTDRPVEALSDRSNQQRNLKPSNSDFTDGDVFSPIRETEATGLRSRALGGGTSESRPEMLGSTAPVSNTRSITNETGGLFSPLTGSSSDTSQRRHPIGAIGSDSSPYISSRPITAGVSSVSQTPAVNGYSTEYEASSALKLPVGQPYATPTASESRQTYSNSVPAVTVSEPSPGAVSSVSSPRSLSADHRVNRLEQEPASRTSPRRSSSDVEQRTRFQLPTEPPSAYVGAGEGASEGAAKTPEGATAIQPFHVQFIKNVIDDALDDFRDQVRKDILNLHVEMIRQFHLQQEEMKRIMQHYSVNEDLVAEVERLRTENEQLKKNY